VADALGVPARTSLGMVPDQNRLSQRNAVGEGRDGGARPFRVVQAFPLIVLEALGPLAGAIQEARVFIANLVAQVEQQILTRGCPARCHEEILLRRPGNPAAFTRAYSSAESRVAAYTRSLLSSGEYVAVREALTVITTLLFVVVRRRRRPFTRKGARPVPATNSTGGGLAPPRDGATPSGR